MPAIVLHSPQFLQGGLCLPIVFYPVNDGGQCPPQVKKHELLRSCKSVAFGQDTFSNSRLVVCLCEFVPAACLFLVFFHTLAIFMHHTQCHLCAGKPLFGGAPEPLNSL